jgi:hypothetical protein
MGNERTATAQDVLAKLSWEGLCDYNDTLSRRHFGGDEYKILRKRQ